MPSEDGSDSKVPKVPADVAASDPYRPTTPADIQRAIDKRRADEAAAHAKYQERLSHDVRVTAGALTFGAYVLAMPFAVDQTYPLVAAALGFVTGAFMGYRRMDHLIAMLFYGLPQMLLSIMAVVWGWQKCDELFLFVAGLGMMHFLLAVVVSVRFIVRR